MSTARPAVLDDVSLLKDVRDIARGAETIGAHVGLRMAQATFTACIHALLAQRPRIVWNGEWLEDALLVELGARAAHELSRARRRARRKARGCSVVAESARSLPRRGRA